MPQLEPSNAIPEVYSNEGVARKRLGLLDRAGVAHELGNLIQIASSAVDIIARSSRFDVAPALEPVISGARVSLERAGVLVRQSLHQADRGSAEVEYVDVAESLAEVVGLIQATWAPKHHVTLDLSTSLPRAKCTSHGLQSAILNLALNARDSMPNGGTVAIAAAALVSKDRETLVEVRVEDGGIGMSDKTLKRAFDPFFTTKSDGLGGVGLPMVKRFVEDVSGRIKVYSTLGSGTCVMLVLPGDR